MNWLSVKLSLKHWCVLSQDLVKGILPFCIIYDHSTDKVNRVPVHVLRGPGATGPPGLRSFPLSTSSLSALPLARTSNRSLEEGVKGKEEEERRRGGGGGGRGGSEWEREGRGGEGRGRRNEEDIPAPPLQVSNSSQLGNACSES